MLAIRITLLSILTLICIINLTAQDAAIEVFVHNHYTYAPLDSALVKVFREGVVVDFSYTDTDGRTQLTITPTRVEEMQRGIPNTFSVSENYPNPFRDETQVNLSIPGLQTVRAEIYNILGQRVLSEDLTLSAGYYAMKLSLSNLSTGIYFLSFRGLEQQTIKLMKVGGDIIHGIGSGSIQVTSSSSIGGSMIKSFTEFTDFTIRVEKDRYEPWTLKKNIESDTTIYVPLVLLAEHLLTDIDGNVYQTVKIGDQLWMAENLRTTRYRNGDAIPTGLSNTDWRNTTSGAYAIYPHDDVDGIASDEEMVAVYGNLYNWYSVSDSLGLCPEGWRVPSEGDWTALVNYVVAHGYPNQSNIQNGAGNALKSRRQVDSPLGAPWATSEHPRWDSHSTHRGLDVFGFSGLPGGVRYLGGVYNHIGLYSRWWSSTEISANSVWFPALFYDFSCLSNHNYPKGVGFSVRCLRDD